MAPIPITIITGFLGAGKTTLILNLLPQLRAANPSYRLALLKNEFGDVAVDSQLTAAAAGAASTGEEGGSAISGVRELLGGCICCNLVGQLGDALRELSEIQPAAGDGAIAGKPDRIVLETSGSAFPATLALEVNRLARETGGAYTLDGVVSVVDVENWRGYEDTSYTARMQARYTDLVVFNKWEDAGERRFDECLDRLGDLELDTPWVKSRRGWVGVEVVFGVDGGLARDLLEEEVQGHSHENGHAHGHEHAADHQTEVEVLSVSLRGPPGAGVDGQKLLKLLSTAPKEEVYRIKTVLRVSGPVRDSDSEAPLPAPADSPGKYILNWAFGRWTFTPIAAETGEQQRSGDETALRMTVILARYESTKWKKKLETGGLLELDGSEKGELIVTKIA